MTTWTRGRTLALALAGLCAGAMALAQATQGGADWPRFRGPNNDGISPETGINRDWAARPPQVLWQVPLTDGGYAGPSVANGLVFIIDHEGSQSIVRALRLTDGTEVWRFAYEDGDRPNYGFARATPTVDGPRVYTMSRFGKLHCLEAATGRLIWMRDVVRDFNGQLPRWEIAVSPLVDGDRLIVQPGGPGAAVVALNKMTGETIWQGGGDGRPGYASPFVATIGGKRQYVTTDANGALGVDPDNGRRLWHFPWPTRHGVNAATPLVIGDSVFIASGYGQGAALADIRGGEAVERWRSPALQAHFNSPVYHRGHIYGTGDPGVLTCLDPRTGRALWSAPGFEKGGMVLVDDLIIALAGSTGDLVLVRATPERYEELGRIRPLGGQSWTAPIVAQGRIIVRNRTTLACLSLR